MSSKKLLAFVLLSLGLVGCFSGVNESLTVAEGEVYAEDFETVNGSVSVNENAHLKGSIEVVNGRINLANKATVDGSIETVNGRVNLGKETSSGSITTVNGRIEIDQGSQVKGDLETVNGGIIIAQGGIVDGNVSAVNGFIKLGNVKVSENVSNYNGGIHLEDGTQIRGDLSVGESMQGSIVGIEFKSEKPLIIIGKDIVIEGQAIFKRDVKLFVHESAKIGKVTGAEAVTYATDLPPESH